MAQHPRQPVDSSRRSRRPGQVEQPTIVLATRVVVIAGTPGEAATRRFTLPTSTRTFEETLDPNDECVYSVLPGDNLYRLSIAFGTTVEAFFEDNDLESDALQIGQLLIVPGCERTEPESPTAGPVIAAIESPADVAPATEEEVATPTETSAVPTPLLPEGPRIHVVSAGETLASIARRYDLSVDDILNANESASADQLAVGQELVIPELDDEPEDEPDVEATET